MRVEKIVQINVGQHISIFKGKQSDCSMVYANENLISDLQECLKGLSIKANTSFSQKDKY